MLASVWWTLFSLLTSITGQFSVFTILETQRHANNLQTNILLTSIRCLPRIPAGQKHQRLWKAPYFLQMNCYVVGKACPCISEKCMAWNIQNIHFLSNSDTTSPRDICCPQGIFVPSRFHLITVCIELSLGTFTDSPICMQNEILVFSYSQSLQ